MKQHPSAAPYLMPVRASWILATGPVVALGFARFAYALILPSMAHTLHWSLITSGAMNAANGVGYLLGALVASRIAEQYGAGRSFVLGLLVTALALVGTAITGNTAVLACFRLLSGVSGGVTFVIGGGLVAQASAPEPAHRAALLLGIYFSGAGLGIMLSAWIVPAVLGLYPPSAGWRGAWLVLGGIGLCCAAAVIPTVRRLGRARSSAVHDRNVPGDGRRLYPVLIAYALFGAGYIVYMTFIVAFLDHRGATPREVILFWTLLGGSAAASGFLWRGTLGRASGGRGMAGVTLLVLSGVLLPLVSTATLAVMGSAVLFGVAFLAVVTAVTAVARRNVPQPHWTAALGYLTAAFGVGQSAGPFLAGFTHRATGGIRLGLALSALLLAVSIAAALMQRDTPVSQRA